MIFPVDIESIDQFSFAAMKLIMSSLWQISIILGVALVLSLLIRKQNPALHRYLLIFALLLAVIMPVASELMKNMNVPHVSIPVLPEFEIQIESLSDVGVQAEDAHYPAQASASLSMRLRGYIHHPIGLLLVCYIIGVSVLLFQILLGKIRIFMWRVNSGDVNDPEVQRHFAAARHLLHIKRNIRLVSCEGICTPFTVGWLRPVVFLPSDLNVNTPAEDLRNIALHELAHIRQIDSLLLAFASVIRAFLFFNPLVWITVDRIVLYSEKICDEAVLRHGSEPVSYAKMLTRMAERLPIRRFQMELLPGIKLVRSTFRKRIISILETRPAHGHRTSKVLTISLLSVLLLTFGAALSFPLADRVLTTNTFDITSVLSSQMIGGLTESQDQVIIDVAPDKKISFIWPLKVNAGTIISSGFGDRLNPYTHKKEYHEGIDVIAGKGDPVMAASAGVVVKAGFDDVKGNFIVISHPHDFETHYTHLKKLFVSNGETVSTGQKIALVGVTGKSTGPHLHFAIEHRGRAVDPQKFLMPLSNLTGTGRTKGDAKYPARVQSNTADLNAPLDSSMIEIRLNDKNITISLNNLLTPDSTGNNSREFLIFIQDLIRFPQKAKDERITSAKVLLEMTLGGADSSSHVKIVKEEPAGYGFADAVLETLKDLTVLPVVEGCPPEKTKFMFTVVFRLE